MPIGGQEKNARRGMVADEWQVMATCERRVFPAPFCTSAGFRCPGKTVAAGLSLAWTETGKLDMR